MQLEKPQSFPEHRLQIIDLIKGIDIIPMVLFNYSVTLDFFGLIQSPTGLFYQKILPMSIASVFIFMSGIAAFVSYERNNENFTKKYITRGLRLLFFAALITISTYIFVPQKTIFFGIIHFFAVSSFLIPVFVRHNKLNIIACISIILAGSYLAQTEFNFSYLFWLGFVPQNLSTFDFFPLIPWMGVILAGIACGGFFVEKTVDLEFKGKFSSLFQYLGKHTLTIYMIHQPLLILVLAILGFQFF